MKSKNELYLDELRSKAWHWYWCYRDVTCRWNKAHCLGLSRLYCRLYRDTKLLINGGTVTVPPIVYNIG